MDKYKTSFLAHVQKWFNIFLMLKDKKPLVDDFGEYRRSENILL
jgi:hypothetical protein